MEYRDKPIKLGLALSGGGFRATIFHIGVLRRLAELDLLREVSVISTVSGGSITGAHYLLHLKETIERLSQLKREDYIEIISKMEREFRRGVRQNSRSRLPLNPIDNLRIFCTARPPGWRMASIYQACFFRDITDTIAIATQEPSVDWRAGIPLQKMLIAPKSISDLEGHNHESTTRRTKDAPIENIPKLILNASSLNTGHVFQFTAVEVGDPYLGFVRSDETDIIVDCKKMLERANESNMWFNAFGQFPRRGTDDEATARRAVSNQLYCAVWFLNMQRPGDAKITFDAGREREDNRSWLQDQFVQQLMARPGLSRVLYEAPFGVLRKAKIAAWYLLDGKFEGEQRRGGYTQAGHRDRFWSALSTIDKQLREKLFAPRDIDRYLLEFILCFYYLRSAVVFAWDVKNALRRLRLVDAAAASANFPPVFTPFHIHSLYDPKTVKFLSLTDGGVHDNTGIKALLEEECTDIIASDVSGLIAVKEYPRGDRFNMMVRIGDTLTSNTRDVQLGILHDCSEVSRAVWQTGNPIPSELEKYGLMSTPFFHMLSNPSDARRDPNGNMLNPDPVPPHPYAREIAATRTDLDVFGKIEIDALIYQGYQLADRFVRRHLSEDAFPWTRLYPPKIGDPDQTPFAHRVLSASSKRVGRVAAIYSRAFWIGGIAVLIALLVTMYARHLTVSGLFWEPVREARCTIVNLFGDGRIGSIWKCYWHLPAMAWKWIVGSRGPWGFLTAAVGLVLFFTDSWERAIGSFFTSRIGANAVDQVRRLNIGRRIGTWRRNITWLVWLLPLWIALGFAAFAGILMLAGLITHSVTGRSSARVFD